MAAAGIPYIASTASSASLEEMAAANDRGAGGPGKGRRWFQLYWPQKREITESVRRHPDLCILIKLEL